MRFGMDWRSTRFDWNYARAFLVTAEEGSFTAAAKALGMTQPAIGRQVGALEQELGVHLFERVGSKLTLTQAGLDLVEHVRTMASSATSISLLAAGKSLALEGTVSITASDLISAYLLPKAIARLREQHPRIEIEIVASNATRDLRRREADIAVRNFQPTEPDLVAKKIGDRVAYPYATPAYLAKIGSPRTVADLQRAHFFGFDRVDRMIEHLARMGVIVSKENFPIVTENHLVQWEMCKRSMGACFVLSDVGDAEPTVRRLTPDFPRIPIPIWLVAHRELEASRRMRIVFDVLAEELAASAPSAEKPPDGKRARAR